MPRIREAVHLTSKICPPFPSWSPLCSFRSVPQSAYDFLERFSHDVWSSLDARMPQSIDLPLPRKSINGVLHVPVVRLPSRTRCWYDSAENIDARLKVYRCGSVY